MKIIKWSDLEEVLLDCTLGRFMDMVEEINGSFPNYSDTVPNEILNIIPNSVLNKIE